MAVTAQGGRHYTHPGDAVASVERLLPSVCKMAKERAEDNVGRRQKEEPVSEVL